MKTAICIMVGDVTIPDVPRKYDYLLYFRVMCDECINSPPPP